MTTEIKSNLPFNLYIFFIISFFLHLPARFPVLGVIRPDLLLVLLISTIIFFQREPSLVNKNPVDNDPSRLSIKCVLILFALAFCTLVFVEWPGTVLGKGIPALIKATVFLFFTISLVKTEKQLKILIYVYLICNVFRVLEPLYLNLTENYWGSKTYIGGGDFAQRLQGSPYDVVNSNGLAFVIASIIPFLHYLFLGKGKIKSAIYLALLPLLFWTMALTLSRTGLLAVLIIAFSIFIKSKRKIFLLCIGVVAATVFISSLNDTQRDRYLSLTGGESRASASAKGRVDGTLKAFEVAFRRPVFGHGLGTSKEANFNFLGNAQPAHNLYAEILQEMGFVGLIVFIFYIKSVISNSNTAIRLARDSSKSDSFLFSLVNALQVWLVMNLLFSVASYGLTSYEWYLFGGLSVAILRIAQKKLESGESS